MVIGPDSIGGSPVPPSFSSQSGKPGAIPRPHAPTERPLSSLKDRISVGPLPSTPAVPIPGNIVCELKGLSDEVARGFIHRNSSEPRRGPDLVHPTDTARIERLKGVYKIYPTDQKGAFQRAILEKLRTEWSKMNPPEKVEELTKIFLSFTGAIQKDGIGVFGDIISKHSFSEFVEKYDALMDEHGNKTWIHSFCDLRRHPEFLFDSRYNKGFFHPLLLVSIAYHLGGAIRVNDARAKDTGVTVVKTLDSMAHCDNVPFTQEMKVLYFWKTGASAGPIGQCFACFPGTNKTPRAPDGVLRDGKPVPFEEEAAASASAAASAGASTSTSASGEVFWTTEAGSVFRTEEELKRLFAAQEAATGEREPQIVALRGGDKVYTGIAETGSVVHHRWRVPGGAGRSCLLISFHRTVDDEGRLVSDENLETLRRELPGSELSAFVLGGFPTDVAKRDEAFLKAIGEEIATDVQGLLEAAVDEKDTSPEWYDPKKLMLSSAERKEWLRSALCDPGATAKKDEARIIALGARYTHSEYVEVIKQCMMYDKAGVLELILYSDGREEKRKWARNQIREMRRSAVGEMPSGDKPPSLDTRFRDWEPVLVAGPKQADLKAKEELAALGEEVTAIAKTFIDHGVKPTDELNPRLGRSEILPSVHQLLNDLSIAIQHCSNSECFHSTGLFLFWATDTLIRITPDSPEKVRLKEIGAKLLKHYAGMNVALEIAKGPVIPPEALVVPAD